MPHHTGQCERCGETFERDRLLYCPLCDVNLCEGCHETHERERHSNEGQVLQVP